MEVESVAVVVVMRRSSLGSPSPRDGSLKHAPLILTTIAGRLDLAGCAGECCRREDAVMPLIRVAAALALLAASLGPAHAQSWPTRPVTIVVPLAAGGGPDALARILAPHLTERLGRQVIIENVPGAGGTTGSNRVAKAPPDGYQAVIGHVGTHAQS